jgi:hypothetical protein
MIKRSLVLSLLGLALLLLAACESAAVSPAVVTQDPTAQPGETLTSTPADVPTAEPTPTPLPGKVLLVAPPGSAAPDVDMLLARLSEGAGLVVERQTDLQPGSLGEDARVVVLLALPENLDALAAASPQVQFVVVSPVDLPARGNLSVIRQQAEYQVMVGGFISVLLSTDFRAAGLLPADVPMPEALADAYINGGRYFCGLCAPGWPLGMRYPQVAQLSAAADGAEVQDALAALLDAQKAEVFYISSAAARPEVYQYLLGKEQFGRVVLLTGEQAPPEELRPQWAATVRFDLAAGLQQLWPDLLAGKGGGVVTVPLRLEDVNEDNLGAGRLRLVKELLANIEAGFIHPFSVPD